MSTLVRSKQSSLKLNRTLSKAPIYLVQMEIECQEGNNATQVQHIHRGPCTESEDKVGRNIIYVINGISLNTSGKRGSQAEREKWRDASSNYMFRVLACHTTVSGPVVGPTLRVHAMGNLIHVMIIYHLSP